MKKEIIHYLMKEFMNTLVVHGSIFDDTPKMRSRASYIWALRRYNELSDEEKERILEKIHKNL